MKAQKLKQINLNILKLAQQQDDLNSVMGLMLSSAECLSNRFGKVKKQSFFEHYNLNNSGNSKNENDLRDQLKIQTKIFRNNHIYMLNQKKKYPYPDNFGKNEIIKIVNFWKENSKEDNYIYFDNIIKVLNGQYNLTYPEKKNHNKGLPPQVILDTFPAAMEYVDNKRDEVRQSIEETGQYNNELKIQENKYETFNYNNNINNNEIKNQNEKFITDLFDKTFKKAENYFILSSNPYYYNCQYGDYSEYIRNNNLTISPTELNNDIKFLGKEYEKYCRPKVEVKESIPNEFLKYYLSAEYWFSINKNDIFQNLKNIFIL